MMIFCEWLVEGHTNLSSDIPGLYSVKIPFPISLTAEFLSLRTYCLLLRKKDLYFSMGKTNSFA